MSGLSLKLTAIVIAAGVIGIGASYAGGYFKGYANGRAAVIERLQSDRITILKDGREIDHEVLGADDDALCALLGGCGMPEPDGGN